MICPDRSIATNSNQIGQRRFKRPIALSWNANLRFVELFLDRLFARSIPSIARRVVA